jgi:Na+/melibiose symporter-like transporter
MVTLVLHLPKKRSRHRIDYLGAALLTIGITSFVLVTTWGGTEYAWGSARILGLIATGAVALALFAWAETRAAEPVLPLHIFRNRNFTVMALLGFVVGFVMFGGTLYLPLFQQAVQSASATNSGVLLMPMLLTMTVVSFVVGRATTRTGRYRVFPIAGAVLMTAGMVLLSTMDTGTSRWTAGAYMAVLGAGVGFLMQITMLVAQNSVAARDMGVASSTSTLFRTLGASFGVAVMGALFNDRVRGEMAERGYGSVTDGSAQLDADGLAALPAPLRDAYQHAVASGTHTAFLFAAGFALAGLVLALLVREVALRGGPTTASAPAPAE